MVTYSPQQEGIIATRGKGRLPKKIGLDDMDDPNQLYKDHFIEGNDGKQRLLLVFMSCHDACRAVGIRCQH
jgi:hypothetical protein